MKKKRPAFAKGEHRATFATPEEVFFSLTRAQSHGYLRGQQQDVLREYAATGTRETDVAFELPTGTGKTTVGLLLAEWKRRAGQKVAYLCLNNQLAAQVIAEGAKLGIPAADLRGDKSSRDPAEVGKFLTSEAVAITTYSNLFNVNPVIKDCGLVVFDDAHGGEHYAADMWTVTIDAQKHSSLYPALLAAFRDSLSPAQFSEVMESDEYSSVQLADVVGHPECLISVRAVLDGQRDFEFSWQQIRAKLSSCLFLISPWEITIRPFIPATHSHPPFATISQRVFLSATLGGRSDLQRAYGVKQIALFRAKSAQWGKRYIFVPGLFTDEEGAFDIAARIWEALPVRRAVLIAPSERAANKAFINLEAKTTTTPVRFGVDDIKDDLAPFTGSNDGMLVLAGRYDGLDLPDDDCRLLILAESPAATNALERHLMSKWKMMPVVRRKERTRLIQGMGRCTRSATDFAIVLWLGQSLVDIATSQSAVKQMPVELQNELAWGIQQVRGAAEDMQTVVDMTLGLIEDRNYRKEANEEIAKVDSNTSGLFEEDDSGTEEVKFSRALWDGDYTFAFETARSIAERANTPSMAGFRGWWWYLASVAARLDGNKTAEIDCLWHSSKSGVYTGFAPHLLSERKADKAAEPSLAVPINVEALWENVETWGWSGPAFDRKLESMSNLVKSDEPTKFHEGLELLGRCVGASAVRPTASGTPDVIWLFVDKFCACFEAKTDKKADGYIYKKDLEETKLHPEWAQHQLKLGDGCEVVSVLISPTPRVDKIALPFVEGIFYLTPMALRALAARTVTVLRTFRAKFAGRDYSDAEKEFAAEVIAAKLDYESIRTFVTGSRLGDASK